MKTICLAFQACDPARAVCYKNTIKLDKVHLSIIRYVLKHEKIAYSIVKKTINNHIKTKYIIGNND